MLQLKLFNQFRRISSASSVRFSNKISTKVEEVRIQVPWGHIAGKFWGPKDVQPILALHGWRGKNYPIKISYVAIE
jgi:hypothetical protein